MKAKVALGRVLEGLGASWEGPGSLLGGSWGRLGESGERLGSLRVASWAEVVFWEGWVTLKKNVFFLTPKCRPNPSKIESKMRVKFHCVFRSILNPFLIATNLESERFVEAKRSFS